MRKVIFFFYIKYASLRIFQLAFALVDLIFPLAAYVYTEHLFSFLTYCCVQRSLILLGRSHITCN